MESSQAFLLGSEYCQKCASCRTLVCCATVKELQQMFVGNGGKRVKSCKMGVTLSEFFVLGNDVSVALCAQTEDRELQRQAVSHLKNDIFDCSGYYFHLRRCKDNGAEFILTCSRSQERKTERDPEAVQRYTTAKEFFACHGELRIAFLKANPTAIITYEHKCHTETPNSMSLKGYKSIQSHQLVPPRLIYQSGLVSRKSSRAKP
ncbi:hypothetical protein V1515DRAFT_589680 [Lipomyces mesembrius]